jgi:hypothetical protein
MFTIFFTNMKLLIAEYLPKSQKYNQDYFISDILPELEREKIEYRRGKQGRTFYIHMDHSKSHDGGKVQEKIDRKGLVRCPYPPDSPDLSLCDCWFFGMAKGKMKDREFRTVQDILCRLPETWNDLTFEDIQSVFRDWQIRLNWVMENGAEHRLNKVKRMEIDSLNSLGILSTKLFGPL